MKSRIINVGIISRDDYVRRTVAIARGKHKPGPGDPKVWFESLRSMAEALNPDNQELLRLIAEENPQSLAELEQLSGRKKSNLSRTLKMLEGYGIVSLSRKQHRLIPKVHATDFKVEFGVNVGRFPEPDKQEAVTR
jgi:predicted transcriptional regulator